jgi:hypothetical protein
MDKIYLNNHIKLEILNICGLSNIKSYDLAGSTILHTLGYNDNAHCKLLEQKLQEIALYYNTGKLIGIGVISNKFTVSQCVQLILI